MGLLSSQGAQRNSNTSSVTTLGGTPDRMSSFYAKAWMALKPYQLSSSNTAKIPTKPEDQLEKCMTRHSSLIAHLRAAGYKVELVPVLIGHSGTIYTSHTLDNMKQLGISTYHARKCALKMHVDAINHLHSIVKTRRHLEPNTIPHDSNSKPNPQHQRGSHFKPP